MWGGGGGSNFESLGDEVDHKNSKGDLFVDFTFDCKIQNPDCKIEILISQLNTILEFVPEEASLPIADEDDQFFFRSDWSCRCVKTSTARILNLLSVAL